MVLPEKAIAFCLEHAGLSARAIDGVVYSFDPELRRATFRADWWCDPRWEPTFLQHLAKVGDAADRILGRRAGRKLAFVPHHVAHAASAYYPSGFDPAAILVIDGIGEACCSTLLLGEGARITTLETISYPHSLGFMWEQLSPHLGFSKYDASKGMGLAAYGDPDVFKRQFSSIIRLGDDDYAVDGDTLGIRTRDPAKLHALPG